MRVRHTVELAALAAIVLIGVGCGPLPEAPVGSFTSPYHGTLGGGVQVPGHPPSNSVTFSGCTSSAGTISVSLDNHSGGTPVPYGSTFTVTINQPGGSDNQSGLIGDETIASSHSLSVGDCFTVTLTASIVVGTSTGCDIPFDPNCLPGATVQTWSGTDYTIAW